MIMTDIRFAEDEAGERAYKRYGYCTGGKTYDGRDMPTWKGLTPKIRNAWRAAAYAVVEFERGLLENCAQGVGEGLGESE